MLFKRRTSHQNRNRDHQVRSSSRESSALGDWDTELGRRMSGPLVIVLMGSSLALGGITSYTAFRNGQFLWAAIYLAFGVSVAVMDFWILKQNRDED